MLSHNVFFSLHDNSPAAIERLVSACKRYLNDHAGICFFAAGTLADAATLKLPRRIPYHVAMDLLLTGRWMPAMEARHWGLVNELLPNEGLLPRARELARLLAEGPPLVFAAIKEVVRESQTLSFEVALRGTRERRFRTVEILYGSEDQKEGARAFAEKREPVWKGR